MAPTTKSRAFISKIYGLVGCAWTRTEANVKVILRASKACWAAMFH